MGERPGARKDGGGGAQSGKRETGKKNTEVKESSVKVQRQFSVVLVVSMATG